MSVAEVLVQAAITMSALGYWLVLLLGVGVGLMLSGGVRIVTGWVQGWRERRAERAWEAHVACSVAMLEPPAAEVIPFERGVARVGGK